MLKTKSEKDELSQAFIKMINSLSNAVGQINDSASSLSAASEQLASAAGQAGQATTQISSTIQQVAKGTQDQAQAGGAGGVTSPWPLHARSPSSWRGSHEGCRGRTLHLASPLLPLLGGTPPVLLLINAFDRFGRNWTNST